MIDKEKFRKLEFHATRHAVCKELDSLHDSIGGANLALTSLLGQLSVYNEELDDSCKLGIMVAIIFLQSLARKREIEREKEINMFFEDTKRRNDGL